MTEGRSEYALPRELAEALVMQGECRRAKYVLSKDDEFVADIREGMPSPGVCPFCDLVRLIEGGQTDPRQAAWVERGWLQLGETPPWRRTEAAWRDLDPEPQPGDGPEYHENHAAWVRRQAVQPGRGDR